MSAERSILELVRGRRGHFALESGLHGALWLDLDPLFADLRALAPHVARLARAFAPHRPDIVCGPLLGGAFLAQQLAIALETEFSFATRLPAPETAGEGAVLFAARYAVPDALAARLRGRRAVLVDDVMSAGSSLRATAAAVRAAAGEVAAVGALLVLGDVGVRHFVADGVPVEYCAREPYDAWEPASCPLCARGEALERPA